MPCFGILFFAFLSFLQKTKEWQRGTIVGNTDSNLLRKSRQIGPLLCKITSNLACLSGIPLQHLHGEPQVAVLVAVEASVVSSDAPQYSRLIQDLRNSRTVGQLLTIDAATVAMLDGVYMTCST